MRHHLAGGMVILVFLMALAYIAFAVPSSEESPLAEQTYLYKTTFVRAAPGKLLELIDLYKNQMSTYDATGDERPFWWRHTQGDQWDLMLLFPMESYEDYYSAERIATRKQAKDKSGLTQADFMQKFRECSAWHEDIFVMGPDLATVTKAFENTGYYHIEIFIALPGKWDELYKERQMENAYQKETGRIENLIFTRDQGAAWDMYTLGCYRDLAHWASRPEVTREQREAAARKAGFESSSAIGPYMRTLIYMHRDTMGVAIR